MAFGRQNVRYKLVSPDEEMSRHWLLEFESEADCAQMALSLDGNRFTAPGGDMASARSIRARHVIV